MAECSKGVDGDGFERAPEHFRETSARVTAGFSLLGRNQEMYRHRIHALHNRGVEYVEAKVMHR